MESTGLRWHRLGQISVENGSLNVVGDGTNWVNAAIKAGDALLAGDCRMYEIDSVQDDTHLTLATAFLGASSEEQDYAIIRNWSQTLQARMASELARVLGLYETVINEELSTIQGLSAYQVATKNGYNGTEKQWLESLKNGPKGDKGETGKSAYEIAVAHGFEGTEAEWVRSLTAPSNYDLAVKNGFTGTLQKYLETLKGASAYELAVQAGFEGTEAEYLESLQGRNGKSSYELAVENGFIGTPQAWLISLSRECSLYCPLVHGPFGPNRKPHGCDEEVTVMLDSGGAADGESTEAESTEGE